MTGGARRSRASCPCRRADGTGPRPPGFVYFRDKERKAATWKGSELESSDHDVEK